MRGRRPARGRWLPRVPRREDGPTQFLWPTPSWHYLGIVQRGRERLPNWRSSAAEVKRCSPGVRDDGNDHIPFSPDLSPRAPHLGLVSHPATLPPASVGGVYTTHLSAASFPTTRNPYRESSWVWPPGTGHCCLTEQDGSCVLCVGWAAPM